MSLAESHDRLQLPESLGRQLLDFRRRVWTIKMTDKHISLTGANSILGRALIVHAKADDLKTQPSGDAGARIAQGVIGVGK